MVSCVSRKVVSFFSGVFKLIVELHNLIVLVKDVFATAWVEHDATDGKLDCFFTTGETAGLR